MAGLPRRRSSLRTRIAIVIVALVALTAAVLGIGAGAFVESSLRQQLLADARRQADYDLGVLLPDALPAGAGRDAFLASGLMAAFQLRGTVEVIADFGDGNPELSSLDLLGALTAFPAALKDIVDRGQLGYAWLDVAGRPSLVIGGRPSTGGPTLYFIRDATEVERAVTQLRIALAVGAIALVLLALLTARAVARGILRPIDEAGRTAARIAAGELDARVPVASADELGAWALEFNRMASTLEETIERLRAAESRNRRFVSDVAHELRTPLTALVAEASLLRDGLPALAPDARRAGELLVGDVARLRALVEDLMELSRFDAGAEQVTRAPIDVERRVRALVEARLPGAAVSGPESPVVVETDPRRFDRIVGNLLDNAREHAPGAPVEVRIAADTDAVRVSVADRGPGARDQDLERLFERFATGDPAQGGRQRPGPGHRPRARRAPRRDARRGRPARGRAPVRARAAGDRFRFVTRRRSPRHGRRRAWRDVGARREAAAMSARSTTTQPNRPSDRAAARRWRPAIAFVLAMIVVGLLAACTSPVGVAGPVATPEPTAPATDDGAIQESTPPPDSSLPPTPTPGGTNEPTTPGPTPGLSAVPELTPTPAADTPAPSANPAPDATAAPTIVRVYVLMRNRDGGDPTLVPVLRSVPHTKAVATAAVKELLDAPQWASSGMTSAVPGGTRLLGISISGSTATVDLTGTFGSGGGSLSMFSRLAQLTYTVTQFSNVDTVLLRMDGVPITALGGEGIMIGGGMKRSDFQGNLPAIFVDRPAWRGALPAGSSVRGISNVFEAQFQLRVLDAGGHIVFDTPVHAACGTGCWGAFGVTVTYSVSKAQWGTLRVFEYSARDGSPTNMRDYPVWLTP